jgi:hypothetical protein
MGYKDNAGSFNAESEIEGENLSVAKFKNLG